MSVVLWFSKEKKDKFEDQISNFAELEHQKYLNKSQ